MTNVSEPAPCPRLKIVAVLAAAFAAGFLLTASTASAQGFFPLQDVRPGQHGVGKTIFQGNRIEDFQVEILGVLQNAGPKQSIILAKLSGGPLADAGVIQGMSGSPVYIDGKLLGAVALGFAFSKQPIAGIQPIEQMIEDSRFVEPNGHSGNPVLGSLSPLQQGRSLWGQPVSAGGKPVSDSGPASVPSPAGSLSQILTPLSLTGLTPGTLQAFAPSFRKLGFEPQQGVSSGSPNSPTVSGSVLPGSMISVQLLSGDMSVSADGTVTYVEGKHVYAFGHRFLDDGTTELPFARSEVIAVLPTLNTSFKLSVAKEWVGTILSDRATAIAGEIGRSAHTIPATISIRSAATGPHDYHVKIVNDRLLTPFVTQMALFSAIDGTERTVGAGTMRLTEQINFENNLPPLVLHDAFVSESGLAQQISADAVVSLSFLLTNGYKNVQVKDMSFQLEPVEARRQLYINQAWTSAHEVHAGDSVQLTILLAGENGMEMTRTATYHIPIGAPTGQLNFTIGDANTLNFPDFAGMNAASTQSASELIDYLNKYRGSQATYVRVWRPQPAFTISGPLPGGELTDPPPSISLVLADPSTSPTSNTAQLGTRGSGIAEITLPVDGYVVNGARTVQVDVK